MKRKIPILLVLPVLVVIMAATACFRTEVPPMLEVEVRDSSDKPVAGAYVALFDSQPEWEKRQNPVQVWRTTGNDGKVTFADLNEIKYFIYARFDGMDNSADEIVTGEVPGPNKKLTVTVHIR